MRNNITLLLVLMALGSFSFAQNIPLKGKPRGKVELNFDNELIEGAVEKPDLDMFKNQIPQRFKRLLKFRENFIDEAQKGQVQFDRP